MSEMPTPPPATPSGYQMPPQASLPNHEHASLSLGLGIVGLLGICSCGVGFLLSPFALGYGLSSRRAIRAEPGRWAGEGMATAGIVLGAVGVVLLVLCVVAAVIFGILVMTGTVHATYDGGIST